MTRLTIIAAAALALFAANHAQAQEYHSKDLTISNSWARPAAEGQYSAIYLTIKNAGEDADTFISAESPVAEKTQVHETRIEDGVMKMRAVKDGIEIKPGSSLEFKPGGYHIMLLGLKKTLEEGAMAPLTITLAKAGAISMEVKVEKTAPGTAEAHPMDMHGMKGMDHSAH
jgi:periplasmic copper chaperone A